MRLLAVALASLALMSAVTIAAGVTSDGAGETAQPSPPERPAQRPNAAPGAFVPSEEISADKPVSFPSDI